jgi:hypothetical protein
VLAFRRHGAGGGLGAGQGARVGLTGVCPPRPPACSYACRYHSRIHAADVLRTMHVLATRGGVVVRPAQRERPVSHAPSTAHLLSSVPGPAQSTTPSPSSSCCPAGYVERPEDALPLLGCYLAAVVHDLEHRWARA